MTQPKAKHYLFFMVIKFCWQEILCLKCNLLVAIANLGSGCAIETEVQTKHPWFGSSKASLYLQHLDHSDGLSCNNTPPDWSIDFFCTVMDGSMNHPKWNRVITYVILYFGSCVLILFTDICLKSVPYFFQNKPHAFTWGRCKTALIKR